MTESYRRLHHAFRTGPPSAQLLYSIILFPAIRRKLRSGVCHHRSGAMANNEGTKAPSHKPSTIIIAIVVPSLMVIVFIALILLNRRRAFPFPLFPSEDDSLVKQERKQKRQSELENCIQTQHFYDWLATQKEKNPGSVQATDPLCAICLEEFDADAQIRGLQCCHAFHSECLDEWFTRYNEFCPLCHGAIIPGRRAAKRRARERSVALPVVMMV